MPNDLVRRLRDAVARSLALAVTAHEECRDDLSLELVTCAIQCAGRASALEAMHVRAQARKVVRANSAARRRQ